MTLFWMGCDIQYFTTEEFNQVHFVDKFVPSLVSFSSHPESMKQI